MRVIRLTHNDISEMIRNAVHSLMNESVNEVMGSAMAEREDVIQEIVDYVVKEWEEIKANGTEPTLHDTGTFDAGGTKVSYPVEGYIILIPYKITKKIGTAKVFNLNVGIWNHLIPEKYLSYIDASYRSTDGTTHLDDEYLKYFPDEGKLDKSRVDFFVTAINSDLQVQSFYSTLYHELNHDDTKYRIKKRYNEKYPYAHQDGLDMASIFTMSKRGGDENPHIQTNSILHPDPVVEFLQDIMFNRKAKKILKKIAFVFYALWETTERNARAEAIYGDLKYLNSDRKNFRLDYPKTELCRQISELKQLINEVESLTDLSPEIWENVASIMGMNKGRHNHNAPDSNFYKAVQKRFVKRSNELLEIMYRKGMKVAELFYQRKEAAEKKAREAAEDKPGGGLFRLAKETNRN